MPELSGKNWFLVSQTSQSSQSIGAGDLEQQLGCVGRSRCSATAWVACAETHLWYQPLPSISPWGCIGLCMRGSSYIARVCISGSAGACMAVALEAFFRFWWHFSLQRSNIFSLADTLCWKVQVKFQTKLLYHNEIPCALSWHNTSCATGKYFPLQKVILQQCAHDTQFSS